MINVNSHKIFHKTFNQDNLDAMNGWRVVVFVFVGVRLRAGMAGID